MTLGMNPVEDVWQFYVPTRPILDGSYSLPNVTRR
jgi:hypothetical protein